MRILHLFNWHLNDINKVLEEVSNQGFDAIQINPIQPLKEDGYDHWWMSYQPCDFSIGNQYGTKEELINLCNNARNYLTIVKTLSFPQQLSLYSEYHELALTNKEYQLMRTNIQ